MEKQIVITAELIGAALVPGTAPSARERAAAGFGTADLFGAALDDPRPPGSWTVPLR